MVKMNKENLLSVLPAAVAASTELTNAQKRVLGQLIVYSGLDEAKENDGWFYRSNDDLCNDVDVSNNTLLSAVRKLYDFGYIDRRAGSRTTGASEYKVLMDCTQIEPLTAPIEPSNCTLNCTHTLDDIYLVMSEILTELKHIGSIIGSVDCTHNCSDKGAKAQVNSAIEPIEPSNCTPDTDTDNKSLNYSRTELIENCSNRVDEISSNEGVPTPDNRKFEEQLSRIRRAVREVQKTDDQEYIDTLQKVMDDACEKARLYATENQLTLINCRIEEFQKFASAEDSTAPEWVRELPGPYTYGEPGPSFEGYLQGVCQGLYDTEFSKRSRLAMICMRKWKKSFIVPAASFYQKDQEQVERGWEDLFNKRTAKYLTPEQPNSTQLPTNPSAGEANAAAVV